MRSLFIMWFALVWLSFTHTQDSLSLVWTGKSPRPCVCLPYPSLPTAFFPSNPSQVLFPGKCQLPLGSGFEKWAFWWWLLDLSFQIYFSLFLWFVFCFGLLRVASSNIFCGSEIICPLWKTFFFFFFPTWNTNTVQGLLTTGSQLWYQWNKHTLSPLSHKSEEGETACFKTTDPFWCLSLSVMFVKLEIFECKAHFLQTFQKWDMGTLKYFSVIALHN